jgi:chromosome segregation ATPase
VCESHDEIERLHGHVAHRDKEIARLDGLIIRERALNADLRAEIERLTAYYKQWDTAAAVMTAKYVAEIKRLEADKKALAFQLDETVANLARNEAEVERLQEALDHGE